MTTVESPTGSSGPGYEPGPKPGPGAPNVVVIVFDDLGFAQLGSFGSDIRTPNIDRLAAGGARYNRFHVTPVCSSTRACLMTGRNHHAVGMGFIADSAVAHPGYNGRIPASAAALPRVMRDAGYSTMATGKWHLLPPGERSAAGPFGRWPLGMGFDRFYGFLGGGTNHWTPELVCDNHAIEPPARPEDGYHLTEDLADQAIRMVLDQQHAAPDKPFFLYFCLGATHSPHHVTPEWSDPYRGCFDHGWDRWREEIFARQIENGVIPPGTVLTERPSWVDAFDDLDAETRRMHVRGQEVFAGFLTHTDAQIGRLIDALERIGELDNTLILLLSDNGASAEGGPHGAIEDNFFTPHSVEENLARLDDWGGYRSNPNYSWGWAWAGNTPFRLWKRYTWLGGTRTSLIAHWPGHISGEGTMRDQFCHAVDLMPTILDACGIEPPHAVDGVEQQRVDGASFAASFDDPESPSARQTQYFEMVGSRSIIDGRWKATTDFVPKGMPHEDELLEGSRDFDTDHWALFDLEQDYSESTDLSAEHPDVVQRLEELWQSEAEANQVFPMYGDLFGRMAARIPPAYPPRNHHVLWPGGGPIAAESLSPIRFGFRVSADVDVPAAGAEGILFVRGDWSGGCAFYALAGTLHFIFNPGHQPVTVVADAPLSPGRHLLAMSYAPGEGGAGAFTIECDETVIGSAAIAVPMPMFFPDLIVGHDRGFPVDDNYQPPFPWTGTIHQLIIDTPSMGAPPPNLRAALHDD